LTNSKDLVILTEEGLLLMKKWFGIARRVPPDLTRIYQMLLHVGSFGGCISYELLKGIGYEDKTVNRAIEARFVVMSKDASKLQDRVKAEIARMVGKPPASLYE
jgi:transcription termination factor Rho